MSYSFSVTASTKAEAKLKISESFDAVVVGQPSHEADRIAVVNCGRAFVDLLEAPNESEEIYVSVYGSLGWRHSDSTTPHAFLSGSVSVSASIRTKS
jgi:flavorubredoxin